MIGKTLVRELLQAKINRLDAEILLAFVLKRDRVWVKMHGSDAVAARDAKRFRALAARRRKGEPVAYLIGTKDFYGRTFAVNRSTLVPRPETELLVERALDAYGDVYWDVGTGSGAIAVTLACERPGVDVLATDVSARALTVAQQNARTHGAKVTFVKSNLLQPAAYRWLKKQKGSHLVVAANLPYLPVGDKKKLAKDVVNYEPASALFSGTDGLDLIQRFLRQFSRHVRDWEYADVTILLEFDPPQAKTLKVLAVDLFPDADVAIHRDLAKRERVLSLRLRDLRTE